MFYGSRALTELDLSKFKEIEATSLDGMFGNMNSLQKLDISNLDTTNITSMKDTFLFCPSLELLDMTSASFNNVTEYSGAFALDNSQVEGKIIVKDDNAKAWVQDKLQYANKTEVVTVSELE